MKTKARSTRRSRSAPLRASREPRRSERFQDENENVNVNENAKPEQQGLQDCGMAREPMQQLEELRRRASEAVAEGERRAEAGLDRMERASGAFWSQAAGNGAERPVQHMAEASTGLAALAARRMRAYVELPGVLLSCRTPQDVWLNNLRFAERAMRDYQDAARQMLGTMMPRDRS